MKPDYIAEETELEILRVFVEVCSRLSLKYYLLAGTLLGAVRHRGFIPWDDDIDVAMFRKDYEVFLAEAQKLLPEHYFLQNYHTDPEYPLGFSRIRDSRTTYIETRIKDKRVNHGIYIDLYTLDYYPEHALLQKLVDARKKQITLRLRSELTPTDDEKHPPLSDRIAGGISKALRIRYPKAEDALREGEKLFRSVAESPLAANYYGCWGKKEIVPLSWFGNGTTGTFEGLEVTLPSEYDKWLTQVYGNYMEYPPVEKRVPRHDAVVIDTERPYTFYCD